MDDSVSNTEDGDRVILTYPTGEQETYIIERVYMDPDVPERLTMIMIIVEDKDEPEGDRGAVSS